MRTELAINGSSDAAARYLTWTPQPCQVRLADASGATGPVAVKLRNKNTQSGGLGVNFGDVLVNRHRVELFVFDDTGRVVDSFTRLQWEPGEVLNRAVALLRR